MHKIKAVKIYVEFYSFLCIIKVAKKFGIKGRS